MRPLRFIEVLCSQECAGISMNDVISFLMLPFMIDLLFFTEALSVTYPKATHTDVKAAVQKWLNGAVDRKDPRTGSGGRCELKEAPHH